MTDESSINCPSSFALEVTEPAFSEAVTSQPDCSEAEVSWRSDRARTEEGLKKGPDPKCHPSFLSRDIF